MNEVFARHVEALHPKFERLVGARAFTFPVLATQASLPDKGIYLFSENGRHLYVGRSNNIRQRLRLHCLPSSNDNQAAFAFRLAREHCGVLKASYKPEGSRKHLMTQEVFCSAFEAQKARLRAMDIRTVGEDEPNRQALLEMYASISLGTPYNDFDNH
jgi:hypothetical protein